VWGGGWVGGGAGGGMGGQGWGGEEYKIGAYSFLLGN
jgi:hypothetical protein